MGDGEKCAKEGDTRKMSVYGSPVLSEIMSVVWKAAEYRSFSYKLTAVGVFWYSSLPDASLMSRGLFQP